MEEEKLTAQTSTENESVQVGNAEPDEEKQVDASENVSDAEFAEYTADAVNNGSGDAEQVQKDSGQSEEVNSETNKKEFGKDSEQARMRRERDKKIALERERKAAEEKAYRKGLTDAVGGVNPYTGETIEDDADIDEYILMRDIDKTGGDPISDYHRYAKEKRKQQSKLRTAEISAENKKKWFEDDRIKFLKEYPDVDIAKLARDGSFQLFARGRIGVSSMSEIYSDFISLNAEFERQAERKLQMEMAKSKASPGSLSSSETASISYGEMSDADFERKLKAVLRGEEKI